MPENITFDITPYIPTLINYGTRTIIFVLGLYIGMKLINNLVKLVKKLLNKQKFDKTLTKFLMSIIEIVLKVLLILSLIQYVGIPTTSFVAILASAGLAIGMALSGTLQNFAGGAMLLALRPFKVGDYIELAGYSGTVESIQVFSTILITPDNRQIIIPNSECSSSSMINYSSTGKRRVDFTFGIGYNDDIDHAKKTLQKIIDENKKIIEKDNSLIAVSALGDNAVELTMRVWVKGEDYWDVFFDITETVKKTFDKEGISFPFPQRDVHLYNENKDTE